MWERTSYEFEKIQSNVTTAEEEFNLLENRSGPVYACNFELKNSSVMTGMCVVKISAFFYFNLKIIYNQNIFKKI